MVSRLRSFRFEIERANRFWPLRQTIVVEYFEVQSIRDDGYVILRMVLRFEILFEFSQSIIPLRFEVTLDLENDESIECIYPTAGGRCFYPVLQVDLCNLDTKGST